MKSCAHGFLECTTILRGAASSDTYRGKGKRRLNSISKTALRVIR